MANAPGYKVYKNDEVKAKLYNHRLATAEQDYMKWNEKAQDWWDRYENVPQQSQSTAKGHTVNVTTGISTIDALFSGLTAIEVEFILDAVANSTPEQARLATAALNAEWDRCDVPIERDAAIKDALIVGIGIVKIGYDFLAETAMRDRSPEEIKADVLELLDQAAAAGVGAPTPDQIMALVPEQEEYEEVIRDRIVTDYVPWDEIRWDPTAKKWADVKWVAQLCKIPLEDVRGNQLWREYLKRNRKAGGLKRLDNIKPDSMIDRDLIVTGKPEEDDTLVTMVEFWDLQTGTFCVLPKGQNIIMFEGVNPFALAHDLEDRNPFVPLVLRSTNRRVRGISDMELILRSLNEKNLYRSRTANYIDRYVPKVLAEEDAFTDEGKKALSSTEYGEVVSVARGTDVNNISPMSPPTLPIEAFNMNDRIDNEMREATGVNELMRGLFPDRKRTATETEEVVNASAARQSEKRNTLERFHVEIGKRILALMQKFYDQPRMLRMTDPEFGNVPWEFDGAAIASEFGMKAHLSPREAHTRDSLKQEATVMLNVLAPFTEGSPEQPPVIDRTTLVSWFMKKYGLPPRDINELLNSREEQQVAQAGAMQAAAGGPPPGPLTPQELLAASNGPATIGTALDTPVSPEQQAVSVQYG